MTTPIPNKIEPYGTTEIYIGWSDQIEFTVPYLELRYLCPCAGCVDENTGVRTIQRHSIPTDIRVTGAQLVGRYALQLSWSDGHQTGMYHFENLREICMKFGRSPPR